jgi:hypothetical protein
VESRLTGGICHGRTDAQFAFPIAGNSHETNGTLAQSCALLVLAAPLFLREFDVATEIDSGGFSGNASSPQTRLVVLDDAGKEQIVIAAPIPDPVVDGKTVKRRMAVGAGIRFKEPAGTERGGIASEDDGSFMFGIDDTSGHAVADRLLVNVQSDIVHSRHRGASVVVL